MNILIVVASCLKVNTSANLCHLAYIQGCIDNGCNVDVISMSEKNVSVDSSIKLPEGPNWIFYDPPKHNNVTKRVNSTGGNSASQSMLIDIKNLVKKFILKRYGIYGRTSSIFLNRAQKYRTDKHYDFMISLATPYASHKLAMLLVERGQVKFDRWIEIWEDPWLTDLYNNDKNKEIKSAEKKLLEKADEIVYVSPLTLKYQKKLYPEFAAKMQWQPLPYYYKDNGKNVQLDTVAMGYFGDYFSFSRNLRPFYNAAVKSGIKTFIFGNSDLGLQSTENVLIKPRVGMDELHKTEEKVNILIFLCNIGGGQIPGKLYQYSATKKHILFILDGKEDEQNTLKEYFSRFNRYVFCKNEENSIEQALLNITTGHNIPCPYIVEKFSPKETISTILNEELQ